MIPLSVPNFEGNEEKYVIDAVSQGWVSTGGAYVQDMEEKIAAYIDVPAAVACQSGTAALHLALIESGVDCESMVIVPTLTFIAAVNPVRYLGAEPVFMDCDDSLCMDPVKLRSFCEEECELRNNKLYHIQSGKELKAVVVVHVFGNLADMEQIMDIAQEYHLRIIEDATEALGSYFEQGRYAGKFAGSIGDFGAFSFNGNKIITTGGGGMLVGTNKHELEHLKYLSTQAKDDPHFYIHNEIGYNYRMTNVQAALGVAQMEELEMFIERKNNNYSLYQKKLEKCKNVRMLPFREQCRCNKWFYSIVIDVENVKSSIIDYIRQLESLGIQTRPIWGLIHMQKPYRTYIAYKIEKAEIYSKRIINIPCSTNITPEAIETVCETISELIS